MMTCEQDLTVLVTCASCEGTFWDWADGTNTLCVDCDEFEPLDFDDWGE